MRIEWHWAPVVKLLALLFGAGLGVVLLGTGGVYVASQDPRFCRTCHYMEPYYRQWQRSTHARVGCVSCHPVRPATIAVSALRYATDTYDMRPRAEVANSRCLQEGCHQSRLLNGKTFYRGAIHFDHATHLEQPRRGKELQCTSCHSRVVQGEHIAVAGEVCFLCHFKGAGQAAAIGGCTTCHAAPTGTVERGRLVFSHEPYLALGVTCQQCHVQVAEGEGGVAPEQCLSCHVERLERYEDSEFIHARHAAQHGVDCFRCHEPIRHGKVRMIQALETDCQGCHEELHSPQKELYLGAGGKGVPDTPSAMFLAQVRCDGCHTRQRSAGAPERDPAVLEAQRQSCVACHGKGYDLMLDDWRRQLDQLVREFGPEVERAASELGPRAASQPLLAQARHNCELLELGRGVHNVDYAVALIRAAASALDQAMSQARPGYQPPTRSPLLRPPDGHCAPLCHARLGLPDKIRFDQREFPHRRHVEEEVGCAQCHSQAGEKHKSRQIARASCVTCHHRLKAGGCASCHPQQEALYTGEVAKWGVQGRPDVMAEGEVECRECHDPSAPISLAAIQKKCVGCHETGYDQMLLQWTGQLEEELARAARLAEDFKQAAQAAQGQGLDTGEAEKLQARAAARLELVAQGKGAHNHPLSLQLLRQSETDLKAALALTGVPSRTE